MSSALRLTDDEVVAAAVSLDGEWRTILPTVDATDRAELTAANARGLRSLAVRQLLTSGAVSSLDDAVAELVRPASAGFPVVVAFPASPGDPLAPAGSALSIFESTPGGERLVVVTMPLGIHELQRVDRARAREVLSGFVANAGEHVTVVVPAAQGQGDYAVVSGKYAATGSFLDGQASPTGETIAAQELTRTLLVGV